MSYFQVRIEMADPAVYFADDTAVESYLIDKGETAEYMAAVLDWARGNPAATSSYNIGHGDDGKLPDEWIYRQYGTPEQPGGPQPIPGPVTIK